MLSKVCFGEENLKRHVESHADVAIKQEGDGNGMQLQNAVLEEVTKSDGEIILFIDEMHTVVGAGVSWHVSRLELK